MEHHHFLLVHGACHGAWSWYKLKHRLESAGHRVTALDLAASGTHTKSMHDIRTFREYTEPLLELMASLGAHERVILVGHSLGGLSLALAADRFPEKISAAVFLTAFMPDTAHRPSYVLEEYCARAPEGAWLDTQFAPMGEPDNPLTSMFFGPAFLSSKLYQMSPLEDLELCKILTRPGSLFLEDLRTSSNFTREGYGSTVRVYVACGQDLGIPLEFQRWMIATGGADHVVEVEGADHMPMLSTPQELCDCLLEIGARYARA
ncbi:salicylic acid-binding protein 2-like [Rhodamnia argentea]|uniref:Salicylic acid-binding protein 2-like n=1 Tax=Rhodamnia argentea TaxID=178133 RepID=A0A8B8QJK3_9MYRT|nr:salicylic acid-binding protein 2-like [Rhodamnia argentea]